MKTSQKGFIIPLLIIIVAALVIGGSIYYSQQSKVSVVQGVNKQATNSPSQNIQNFTVSTTTQSILSLENLQSAKIPISYSGAPVESRTDQTHIATVITLQNGKHNLTGGESDSCFNAPAGSCYISLDAKKPNNVQYVSLNGIQYALVTASSQLNGTGYLTYALLFTVDHGKAVFVASEYIGDRIDLKSLTVQDNMLTIKILGPGGSCCNAKTPEVHNYKLINDHFVEQK